MTEHHASAPRSAADRPGADPLREDARAAWAYRTYLRGPRSRPLHPDAGTRLLAAVEPDDHVELIAEAAVTFQAGMIEVSRLTRDGTAPFVAALTMRRWILVERATGAVVAGFPSGAIMSTTGSTTWPNAGWCLTVTDDDGREVAFKVFADDYRLDRLEKLIMEGASGHIMLLPEQAEVPTLPGDDGVRVVLEYCQGVADRIAAAVGASVPSAPGRDGRYPGHGERALRYLYQAQKNLRERPGTFESLRSAAVYHHHTELLAHVWFREMGVPYPDGERPSQEADTLDSFYR